MNASAHNVVVNAITCLRECLIHGSSLSDYTVSVRIDLVVHRHAKSQHLQKGLREILKYLTLFVCLKLLALTRRINFDLNFSLRTQYAVVDFFIQIFDAVTSG